MGRPNGLVRLNIIQNYGAKESTSLPEIKYEQSRIGK